MQLKKKWKNWEEQIETKNGRANDDEEGSMWSGGEESTRPIAGQDQECKSHVSSMTCRSKYEESVGRLVVVEVLGYQCCLGYDQDGNRWNHINTHTCTQTDRGALRAFQRANWIDTSSGPGQTHLTAASGSSARAADSLWCEQKKERLKKRKKRKRKKRETTVTPPSGSDLKKSLANRQNVNRVWSTFNHLFIQNLPEMGEM